MAACISTLERIPGRDGEIGRRSGLKRRAVIQISRSKERRAGVAEWQTQRT
jgi:hypothetical protein